MEIAVIDMSGSGKGSALIYLDIGTIKESKIKELALSALCMEDPENAFSIEVKNTEKETDSKKITKTSVIFVVRVKPEESDIDDVPESENDFFGNILDNFFNQFKK